MNSTDKLQEYKKNYRCDDTLQVGDNIVCDIRTGIHKITSIKKRYWPNGSYSPTKEDSIGLYNPVFEFQAVYDIDGNPCSKRINSCDAAYCHRLDMNKIITELEETIDILRQLKI